MASDEWKSFEVRMRHRRAANCRTRAGRALDAGLFSEARSALDEARTLNPASPELARLEEHLAAAELSSIHPRVEAPHTQSRWAFRIATAAVLAGAAIGAWAWFGSDPPGPPTADHTEVAAATPQPSPRKSPADRVAIETTTVTAEATREIVDVQPPGAEVEPAVAASAIATEPEPAVAQRSQPDANEPDLPVRIGRAPDTANALIEVPSIPPAAPSAVGTALAPVQAPPAPVGTTGEAADPAAAPVREDLRVRSVLARYEAAYSALDPLAARSVWPGVDAAALARAFNSLESQRISLGECEIAVAGASARADCSGTQTWMPKVGGGPHVQTRQWSFELTSNGGDWLIARATVR